MYKLVISDDEGKPTVVPLVRDEISIGRAEGNTVRLTDRNVSRRHAVLERQGKAFVVRDLGAYNGTFVDGTKVEGECPLEPGAEVRIGDYQISLHMDSSEVTEGSQASRLPGPDDAGPPARLIMLTMPVPGAEFALAGNHVRIGRSEDLEIWINHRSISREHAEVVREEDGSFRLADLGSANGIRLNGEEVDEAVLEPYDVIKLGRVRLRYVPEGEAYLFDPAAEEADEDDATEADSGSSRAPLFMALGVVVLALAAGGAIVAYSTMPAAEADRGAEGPVADGSAPEVAAAGAGSLLDAAPPPKPDESLASCREALREARWQEAVEHAEAVLAVRPDDMEAADCRLAGRSGVAFVRGQAALQEGDLEDAYAAFAEIPEDNPFRQHPSIAETTAAVASQRLTRAREALADDLEEARRLVEAVLAMEDASKAARADARRVLRTVQVRTKRPRTAAKSAAPAGDEVTPGEEPAL
jgi:ABC transport system ATP-binding/permease protein